MSSGADRRRLTDAIVLGGLVIVTVLVFSRVFELKPLGEDNFYVMSWVDRAPASSLLRLDPAIYPEWRPLAYQTVWLQYRWAGLARMADYYVFNVGVWALVAWLVYLIVRRMTASVPAACGAALFMLSDTRAIPSVAWIVERQSSMACLFGLVAMWVVLRADGRRMTAGESVGVAMLLLGSALSKEYGLAFSGAIVLYAWWQGQRHVAMAAVAAGVVYGALRLTITGGAATPYCGDIGFFSTVRKGDCYHADIATAVQMAYNVVASGIGSVVRGLFEEDGRIAIARMPLLLSLCWLVVALVGWRSGSKAVRLAALVILGNTALSFMLYQPRNQLVALCGVAIVAGAGMAALRRRSVVTVGLALLLVLQVYRARVAVGEEVDQLMQQDPCAGVAEHPEVAAFARRVKSLYGTGGDCRLPG